MKKSIIEQLESKEPRYDNPHGIDVASIMFAYDHFNLIELLRKRGQVIQKGETEKIREIEDQIELLTEQNN